MEIVNAVKMIILVWTFASVCEAGDDPCTFINCADVTGTVHKELTLTCSILLNCTKEDNQCCVILYMFKDENKAIIDKKEFPDENCEQEIKATCSYNQSENMTQKVTFFSQTSCGTKKTEFVVNIRESARDTYTDSVKKGEAKLTTSEVTVTVTVIAIAVFVIVIMFIIYRKRKPQTLQRVYKTADSATEDDDDSRCSERSSQKHIRTV